MTADELRVQMAEISELLSLMRRTGKLLPQIERAVEPLIGADPADADFSARVDATVLAFQDEIEQSPALSKALEALRPGKVN